MNYIVQWRPSAERRLAELWTDATDRDAVARAADSIDSTLRRDPGIVGESRSGDTRVLIVEPLGVYFEVNEGDRTVWVFSVWSRNRDAPPRQD